MTESCRSFGKIILDLPPSPGNARNSEAAFHTRKDGTILCVYSRFLDQNDDHARCDIILLISEDGGGSFHEKKVLLTSEQEQAQNVMSLSMMEMQNGDIGLFYLIRKTQNLMRLYLRRSPDGGETWSDPVCCTPQEGYFVVNNDRVIRLSSGRILVPAAFHRKGFGESPGNGDYFDSRAETVFFYSDDDGVTWTPSADKCVMPSCSYCSSGLQEPGALDLGNGLVWAWARTDLGRQYEMFSLDEGVHWTACQPSRFTAPLSPLSMKRVPSGELLAFWNPIPLYNGRPDKINGKWMGGRTPFVFAVSRDNGKTFSGPVVLEDDPCSGYCYCAIHFIKEKETDSVLLAYCAGNEEDGSCLLRLRIRKIPLQELLEAAEHCQGRL